MSHLHPGTPEPSGVVAGLTGYEGITGQRISKSGQRVYHGKGDAPAPGQLVENLGCLSGRQPDAL